MAYAITISDTVDEMVITSPSPPLKEQDQLFEAKVTVLSGDMYIDHFATKKLWETSLKYMSATDYTRLKGFENRQRSLWQYPVISIPDLDVNNVVVYFELSPKQVIDNCGTVEGVEMSFRETVQMTTDFGS